MHAPRGGLFRFLILLFDLPLFPEVVVSRTGYKSKLPEMFDRVSAGSIFGNLKSNKDLKPVELELEYDGLDKEHHQARI